MSNKFRFSPISSKEKLLEAIEYTHFACFELLKRNFGKYLCVAGNIGIFCHLDDEYKFLSKLREEMTISSGNWNEKYFRLHDPIMVPARGDIPETVYTYLYIRKPDQHTEVGDIDFVMDKKEYDGLKSSLVHGKRIKGIEILDRPELDLIKVFDQDADVLSFIGKKNMFENLHVSD